MGRAGTSRTRLGIAAVVLAQAVVVLTILTAVGFALCDAIQLEKDTPTDARRTAWSSSEHDRMRSALVGWHPIVDGVRRSTPQRAVIWCWTGYPTSLAVLFDLMNLLRAALAPRLSLPVISSEFVAAWEPRLSSSGRPIYFLEIHPSFAPESSETRPAPAPLARLREWPVVQRHSDFTLRQLDRGR